MRRQVQGTCKKEGYAVQAPGTGRNATYEKCGSWPERAECGHQVEDRGRRLGGVLELARRAPGLRAPGCRTCRLVPSSIEYACRKWSIIARTDAPELAPGCPWTMPRETATRIRFRACINRPCQRPEPFLTPSLPSSHPLYFVACLLYESVKILFSFEKSRRCDDYQQITVFHFGEKKRLHLESPEQNCYYE